MYIEEYTYGEHVVLTVNDSVTMHNMFQSRRRRHQWWQRLRSPEHKTITSEVGYARVVAYVLKTVFRANKMNQSELY